MRKAQTTAIAALFLFPAVGVFAEEIRACGHPAYAPWNWEQRGKIVGVCAEVAKTILEKLGYTINLASVGPWSRCQAAVRSGEVDMNICSFINTDRQAYSEFVSTPMGYNEHAVFVHKGHEFSYNDWADLKHKEIARVLGVSTGDDFDQFLQENTQITPVGDFEQAFRMLRWDRVDMVVAGRLASEAMLTRFHLEHDIVDLQKSVLPGEIYISISKRSKYLPLIPKIEALLKEPSHRAFVVELMAKYRKIYLDELANGTVDGVAAPKPR